MTDKIYTGIKLRLDTLPELKKCHWYFQQELQVQPKNQSILKTPAVLIEFKPYTTKSLGRRYRSAQVDFVVHFITSTLKVGDKRIQDTASSSHYPVMNTISNTLIGYGLMASDLPEANGLKGTDQDYQLFNSICEKSVISNHIEDKMMITQRTFTTFAIDASARKTLQSVNLNLHINDST